MFERQMPQYQCHKRVWALQILEVIPNENPDPTGKSGAASYGAVLIVEDDFAPIKVDASYMTKHQPVAGGYYVIYEGGYKSFSPKEPFEDGYERVRGMGFGDAIRELKRGKKVARFGWNGKGMFLFLVPGETFSAYRSPWLGLYPEGTELSYCPHIDMRTADGKLVPWLASQTDVLADDWGVVD